MVKAILALEFQIWKTDLQQQLGPLYDRCRLL